MNTPDSSADARDTKPGRAARLRRVVLWLLLAGGVAALLAAHFADRERERSERSSRCALSSQGASIQTYEALGGTDALQALVDADGMIEILVNLEDDRDDAEAALEAKFGFDLVLNSAYSDPVNLFRTRVPAAQAEAILADLSDDDGVEYAELNGQLEAFGFVPNDPLYMYQWNFEQVGAEDAWSTATGKGVVVAVIDTGVAYEDGTSGRKRGVRMPDLAATGMVRGYDFVDDDESPWDQHGHGTHVAGTIAQSTNNDYGVAGLAFDAQIMPLRVLDRSGRGNFADVADAIRFAADNGAHVINLSLGSFVPSREVEAAVRYAYDEGVVVVAAAGNSGTRVRSYPAAFDHVIAVAATQYDRSTTFYSNYGSYVDLAAPGGNVLVDQNKDGRPDGIMQETLGRDKDGNVNMKPAFALYMGTSMAAPHVAAAAALLIDNGITHPDEIERLLKASAVHPDDVDWDERYGAGIIDVTAALKKSTLDNGLWRTGTAFVLAMLALVRLRRRGDLEPGREAPRGAFWGGWLLGAGALFALPLLIGTQGLLGPAAELLGRPFMTWDTVIAGPGDTNPLLASVLPAFALTALLLGARRGRHFAAGFGLATGAVLLVEAMRQTVDVAWLPGVGLLDQSWLALNGLAALGLGYLALKRR